MTITNKLELILDGWYDDYESLLFFSVYKGKNQLWSSSWHDPREFSEDKNTIEELRKEVAAACAKYNISADLSSNDLDDWEVKNYDNA